MKPIFIPLLVLFSMVARAQTSGGVANPSKAQSANKSFMSNGSHPLDYKAMYHDTVHFVDRPFVSVAEANSFLPSVQRVIGMQVSINTGGSVSGTTGLLTGGTNDTYYYKDGIADGNLVLLPGKLQTILNNGDSITAANQNIHFATGSNIIWSLPNNFDVRYTNRVKLFANSGQAQELMGSTFIWLNGGDSVSVIGGTGLFSVVPPTALYGSLKLTGLGTPLSDTSTNKPLGINSSTGAIVQMDRWPGGGSGSAPTLQTVVAAGNSTDNALRITDVATHTLGYASLYQSGGQGRLDLANGAGPVTSFYMDSVKHRDSTLRFPNKSGTLALLSDITSSGGTINLDSLRTATQVTITQSGVGTNAVILAADTSGKAGVMTVADKRKLDDELPVFNPIRYGGRPDCKRVFDGAISASSTTFTSVTAGFTSADAGKGILITGAGIGGKDFTTSIVSVTNSTTVVLAAAASTTVSADTVNFGTDNTATVQAAANAAFAAGGGKVVFPVGAWFFNGALQTSVNGKNPNCVIFIPDAAIGGNFNSRTSIEFEGAVIPNETVMARLGDTLNTHTGVSLIVGTQGSGNLPAFFGTKGRSGDFNYNYIKFKNLAIKTSPNLRAGGASIAAINCFYCASSHGENINVSIDHSLYGTDTPRNEIPGIVTNGNGGETSVTWENCSVLGYKYAYVLGDHVYGPNLQALGCTYALAFAEGNFPFKSPFVLTHWCTHQIYSPTASTLFGYIPTGIASFQISCLEMEPLDVGTWREYQDVISDSANHFDRSEVKYHFVTGHEGQFVRRGGNKVIATNIGTFGNEVDGANVEMKLGDSARASAQIKLHYNTGGFSNGSIITYVNNTQAVGLINDNGGYFSGTYGSISGRTQYVYDYILNRLLGGWDSRGAFTVGQNMISYGARFNYPTGSTFGITVHPSGNVTIGDTTDVSSAILKLKSTSKAFLPPVMTHAQMVAISSPALGFIVVDSDSLQVAFYNGSAWVYIGTGVLGGGSSQWTTTGSNIYYSTGKVWIGTSSGNAPLHIKAASVSGFGQFTLQAASGSGSSALVYKSIYDGSGSRMYVEGFGQYAGSPDPNYYYANEINGSYIYRNSASQIAELTTSGNWGLGRTPTKDIDVFRTGVGLSLIQIENNSASGSAGFNAKNNSGEVLQLTSNGASVTGFGVVPTGAAYAYGTNAAGFALVADGPLLFGNASAEFARFNTSGKFGIGVTSPSAFLHLAAATTGAASLRLQSSAGTNVTSPNSGDLWWNGTNLNFRTGSGTVDLLSGGGITTSQLTDSLNARFSALDQSFVKIITTTDATPVNIDTLFTGAGSNLYSFQISAQCNSVRTDGTFGSYSQKSDYSFDYNGSGTVTLNSSQDYFSVANGGISSYTGMSMTVISSIYSVLKFTGQAGKTIQTTLKYGISNMQNFAP